jgi:hypothetical protein
MSYSIVKRFMELSPTTGIGLYTYRNLNVAFQNTNLNKNVQYTHILFTSILSVHMLGQITLRGHPAKSHIVSIGSVQRYGKILDGAHITNQ